MNLHEKCLLKYLENPLNLSFSTEELIKINDLLTEQESMKKQILAENKKLNCAV